MEMGVHDFDRIGLGGRTFVEPFELDFTTVSTNITPNRELGIGAWTDAEIKAAITQGVRPDGPDMVPFMGFHYYQNIAEEDLDALVAYLRTLDPLPRE
jgi:hypothetical protein